ncbi:hypothetical protein Krac_3965 [Ktedonobacter racemifer DSM 44963]|uniref:Uncharacterized protein n=1 Tax=Ktedonobacter racemifer DSM 44963 TaxID=485913 RepID=D6U3R2_KTERA|nr:hypothetical protein Krac_3965 [Ktedonobacter racemifer DSM 44963]
MTSKSLLQCSKDQHSLLAQRREVAANAAEADKAIGCAEAARDLLLDLDHAQVPFGLIVIKGHAEIQQEAQHASLAGRETVQQVTCRALFGPVRKALVLLRLWWLLNQRIDLEASLHNPVVAREQRREDSRLQSWLASHAG